MRRARLVILWSSLFIGLLFSLAAAAAIPRAIHVQAFLADGAGAAVTGNPDVEFCLYTVPSGGIAQWCDTRTVTVNQGLFDVELNETATPTTPVFPVGLFDTPLYLGLNVAGDGEMSPRIALTSEAYAFKADDAETVGGQTAASLDQSAHVADMANPHHVTAVQTGAVSGAELAGHAADPAAHHLRYGDSEAVAAMGAEAPGNPLNHARTTNFSELGGQVAEAQIPAVIARDSEIMSTVVANGGTGSGLDADLFDGLDSTSYAAALHHHDPDYVNVTGDTMTGALVTPSLTVDTNITMPGEKAHTAAVDSNTRLGIGAGATFDSTIQAKGNVAFGNLALNVNGMEGNTAVGYSSLKLNNQSNNTAIGAFAGLNNSGYGNVFLGYSAGRDETSSGKLYIANNASAPLIYGDFSLGRVGIGTTNPGATLDVNGAIRGLSISGDGAGLTGIPGTSVLADFGGQDIRTTGRLMLNELTPKAWLSVNGDAVFTGPQPVRIGATSFYDPNPGAPLAISGPGGRMVWYPGKAAFRVGLVDALGAYPGTQWDDAHIGMFSFAAGYNTYAAGYGSIAMGSGSHAFQYYGIALGYNNTSSSANDIAIGSNARALNGGDIAIGSAVTAQGSGNSVAIGGGIDVRGQSAIAIGHDLTAPSYGETVIGRYNTPYTPAAAHYWSAGDRLFTIGNGLPGAGNEADALVVLKNGRTGLGTSSPRALLDIEGDVLLAGATPSYDSGTGVWTLPAGNVPLTGPGGRAMWYPRKAAFRAGMVDNSFGSAGDQWDDANIGLFSVALGENTRANGKAALAMGYGSLASGDHATAMGRNTQATNVDSLAMGQGTRATGAISTAMGATTTAAGDYSLAAGLGTTAASRSEAVFGEFNTRYTPAGGSTAWDDRDRLFVIGNGVSGAEKDAMVVFKSGRTGIGTVGTPAARLHIANPVVDNTPGKHTLYLTESNNLESSTAGLDPLKPYYGIGFRRAWNNNNMSNIKDIAGIYTYGVRGYRGGLVFKTENAVSADNPDTIAMVIRPDGNVGIGDETPQYKLTVNGTAFALGGAGALSDRRHKEDIESLAIDALAVIKALRPVSYSWKEPRDSGMEGGQIGFIAQEVEEVLPEVVLTMDDEDRTKGLKYSALIPVLTRAIQEQQAIIEGLVRRIEALEN